MVSDGKMRQVRSKYFNGGKRVLNWNGYLSTNYFVRSTEYDEGKIDEQRARCVSPPYWSGQMALEDRWTGGD